MGPPAGPSAVSDVLARYQAFAVEFQLVLGMMALSGLFLVISALSEIPVTFDLLGADFDTAFAFGALNFAVIVVLLAGGVGAFAAVWFLRSADRFGRLLAYVVVGSITAGLLVEGNRNIADTIALLSATAVAVMLAVSPRIRDMADREVTLWPTLPVPLKLARLLIIPVTALNGLTGLMFLPVADLEGKFAGVGLLLIASAAVLGAFIVRMKDPDTVTRLGITAAAGAAALAGVWSDLQGFTFVFPLALSITVAGLLWVPASAVAWFAAKAPAVPSPMAPPPPPAT